MQAADGASAGRKPWRFYYVMTLPLSGGVAQDKARERLLSATCLQEMTEMTAAIEQREEEYLRKVAARNAAALEAERRSAQRKEKPTVAAHVAWVLRRLYVVSAVLLLVAVAAVYALYAEADGRERVPQGLAQSAAIAAVLLLVVNAGGWVAAHRRSVNGARVLLVVDAALVLGLGLLLDEVALTRRSHVELRRALAHSKDALSQDAIDRILNGGTSPSLVQRFVLDAPSLFLQWLRVQCSGSPPTKLGYASVAIDRRDFFSPFWNHREKTCVDATLGTCVDFDDVAQPIIIAELVLVALQLLFTGVFLFVCDPLVTGKRPKRRKQFALPKPKAASSADLSRMLRRLLLCGAALFGSSNAIASTNLLGFCSIADFRTLFTWVVVASLLSGLSALLAALFIGCGREQQVAGALLVVAVASEMFMLAELIQMAARLVDPDLTAESDQVQAQELREVYEKASAQTCSSIENWISHVCVRMANSENRAEFDGSCQHEFVALLGASFEVANSYLAWSIGVKLVLLVQLVLPALRQALVSVAAYMCCISSPDDLTVRTVWSLQHSSPPIDYEEALEVYLGSMRVRDPARLAAEREAFEKEWSVRTGRALSDVRTPRVVLTASDFGAIVRTLMLRRLTAVCKLDVSLSVSEDGQLLLVRISASDNLLLATLCETETYRLEFAEAIDPGRSFWRDRREVNADQKVLDANTAKHKLKLLLAEKAMPPKEAAWLPGESLARVSARVHALSRISRASRGLICCCNPAPAFASYSPSIQRQFLYKKYPHKLDIPETYRRSVVLRTVDCIRVTRRIIDAEFDTNATIASGLVTSFHCLHSSSRFDLNSRGVLASSWITFWRPTRLPGEFYPNAHAILNLLGRIAPFRQPLQDVRDYFGDVIGFYFAWFAFYAKMMAFPAFISMAVLASDTKHSLLTSLWNFYTSAHTRHADNAAVSEGGDKMDATLSLPELILGLGVLAWSFALVKLWERRGVWYRLRWGVTTSDSDSVQQYNADHGTESLCSEFAYLQRQVGSWLCVLALGSANLLAVLAMLLSQGWLVDVWGEKLAVLGSSVCQAVFMQWNGACIPLVAQALAKWENPRYSSDHPGYQSSVVIKLFTLQVFNTFTGLVLLVLSSVGGLALLVHLVAPLNPLYVSYNARIEGHVGVFVQLETLLISLFAAQSCIRVFLVLSAVRRFRVIQRRELRYSRKEHEEETMLPPYPGPHKDYAQVVMQLGLVVMFSSVCPLLPLLALIDCAVKLRQNALELCCIRQRPEPETSAAQTFGSDGDDVCLGLWGPCMLLMLKLSVPVALSLAFFPASNFDDISIERRVGYWLIGVLGIWLVAQLLWFLIPRESRSAEAARARNSFLVERYFGHAEVHELKKSPTKATSGKRVDLNLPESAPSAEQSLRHYEERLELLHRLNVALRKRDDMGGSVSLGVADMAVPAQSELDAIQEGKEVHPADEVYRVDTQSANESAVFSEVLRQESESSEEMIVGYFRPVRGKSPQSPAQREEVVEEKAPPIDVVEERRGSIFPGALPVEEMKTRECVKEEDIAASRAERGGDAAQTGSPPPMMLSKLFKRMPPPPPANVPSSESVEAAAALISPFVSIYSSFPQGEVDPGVFAPTEAERAEFISREPSRDDELLEDKQEASSSCADESGSSTTAPAAGFDVDLPLRRFAPRVSFLSRKPKSPASVHSEDGSSNRESQVEAGERTLLRQLSPRLVFLSRKSKRSSAKVSGSEESESPVVPEPPAPRRLSELFKRTQPPSPATTAAPEPPSPVVTNLSAFERTEAADRTVDPVASRRDQFDFLSEARSYSADGDADSTATQSSLPTQRRKPSDSGARPPSPPPVYTKIDLSGLEAVLEAANRRQFDFSADEQGTNQCIYCVSD
ncbi:hypothetical protein PHYPSEUDO_012477 [Phytophthora pseudosyringae]|uniref:Anoctamin transmembrane domain-containing protein n=1 Tax=Phytophthora pseudosyringae TaxID=221518 RepID=A0A8T1WJ01_9STRA|nr:hypothetical protein PHYPSEUDO_012477 [Phytophthora pseudosyringae]